MSRIAVLKTKHLDGLPFINDNVFIGKEYIVSDYTIVAMWLHKDTGHTRDVTCVQDLNTGGWIPIEVLTFISASKN